MGMKLITRKIVLSSAGTQAFAQNGEVMRKDFIRAGTWCLPDGSKLPVTDARIKKWEDTFKLFRERGITVPLTVDHMEIRDPETGKMMEKRLTPAMAEAKRGDVVGLFADGNLGMFDAKPADADAQKLMERCPEVSLELDYDFYDGHGNFYEEGITAITLTPKPVIPGQQGWKRVAASRTIVEGADGTTVYLSAEPEAATVPPTAVPIQEFRMTPQQIARARQVCGIAATVPDTEVPDHVLNFTANQATELTTGRDTITRLSRDVTAAGAAPVMDEDAAEMAATAMETRINALGQAGKATPAQRTLLLSMCCGTAGKRPAICLSRKIAVKAGLDGPLADSVLKVFEAGDPVEMAKLLAEQSKSQGNKIVLSRANGEHADAPDFDPELQKRMIANANGGGTNATVL